MKRWATGFGALIAVGLAVPGCGFDACGNALVDESSTAPRVDALRLAGQLEDDPWTLVFAAEFTDTDGDLAAGQASFHLNGQTQPSTRQPLLDVFRQSGLAVDARGGELAIPLRFGDTIDDGSKVRIGLQLEDDSGQAGNCYPIEIQFDVRAASAMVQRGVLQLASLWQEDP